MVDEVATRGSADSFPELAERDAIWRRRPNEARPRAPDRGANSDRRGRSRRRRIKQAMAVVMDRL